MITTIPALDALDFTTGMLATSPLTRPLAKLAEGLNALVREGFLQGVELDLRHLDCPCFLLSIAPDKPAFYVELFRGNLDDAFEDGAKVAFKEDEQVPLCVLMNWLGSDTEPVYWETEWQPQPCEPRMASEKPDFVEEPDFGEVLAHIRFLTSPDVS